MTAAGLAFCICRAGNAFAWQITSYRGCSGRAACWPKAAASILTCGHSRLDAETAPGERATSLGRRAHNGHAIPLIAASMAKINPSQVADVR